MATRLRTALRAFLLLGALALIVIGRTALVERTWQDSLLRTFGPVATFVGGAFTGMTVSSSALPFFLIAAGCVVFGLLLPPPEKGRDQRPEVAVGALSRRAEIEAAVPFALACLGAVLAAGMLRGNSPGSGAVATWLAALVLFGAAAWILDRGRGTPFGNPLPERRDWIAVLALFGADLLLVAHDLGHWRWLGTPDEANFFPFARDIALGRSQHFILSERGMYDVHPLLSSHYQAWFMRLFGVDVFGWRLSSAFALAASLPFVYVLGRELWSRRFGLYAAILFGTTPLAIGFAHFGYNNAQIYLFVTGSLALLAWAMRRRSLFGYFLAGAVAGLAVFTFYPARLALPLLFLLAVAVREWPWRRRAEWAVLLLAAVIAATPCLVHPLDTLGRMVGQTAFRSALPTRNTAAAPFVPVGDAITAKAGRVARHFTLSLLFPLWYPTPSHFQATSVVDPLQGALAVSGLVLAWRGFRRQRAARFLALAYPFSALAVGAVSQHDAPPLTRLLFLCPFVSMVAALSVEQIAFAVGHRSSDAARGVGGEPHDDVSRYVAAALVALSVVWGVGILRYSVYVRGHGYGEGTTSEVVRMMRALPPDWKMIYVQKMPTYMASVDAVVAQLGMHERFNFLRDSPEVLRHMPEAAPQSLLVVHDLPPGERRESFETAISARFPGSDWHETAPGKRWNMRALPVAREGGEGGWQPPSQLERNELGQVVLGFLDW